jgi:hypothetical protein
MCDYKPMSWPYPLRSHKPPEWSLSFGQHLLLLSAASSSPLLLMPSLPLHLNLHRAESTEIIYHQILLRDDIPVAQSVSTAMSTEPHAGQQT